MKERKCPNCGSGRLIQKDEIVICQNCGTTFHDSNKIEITNINIDRNEAKIEGIKAKERAEKRENRTLIIIIACVFAMFGLVGLISSLQEKEISAPGTSDFAFRNDNKIKVINAMTDAGFTDVQAIPLEDLGPDEEKKVDLVESVTIGGEDSWTTGPFLSIKKYKKSTPVKIYYHSLKPRDE